jgi:hypothetical protein
LEANFGDNPAKPFKFDIDKCPGLVVDEIWVKELIDYEILHIA